MHLFAIAAGQWAVVDAECDGDGGRVNRLRGDRHVDAGITQGVGDGCLGHTGDGDDVTRLGQINRLLRQTTERQDFRDTELLELFALARHCLDGIASFQRACFDTAREDTTDKRVSGQGGGKHLERLILAADLCRCGNMLHNQVKQRIKVFARPVQFSVTPTGAPRGEHGWEIKLFIRGFQSGEEVKNLIHGAVWFTIGLIDFVDHHDRTQAQRKRFGGDEFCLWHRAFSRVNQQNNTVHH